jgi:membrane-bound ClpP family serine protease
MTEHKKETKKMKRLFDLIDIPLLKPLVWLVGYWLFFMELSTFRAAVTSVKNPLWEMPCAAGLVV